MTATADTIGFGQSAAPRPDMRLIVGASAAGTAFEWYDFFVFVPLASILAKTFSAGLSDAAGLVFALGSFAVGFAFRPVGALIFGRLGDTAGRKGAFLITVSMMGAATFLIGCLPSFAQVGALSPILFLFLRVMQGIALGGEYGGAAVYVSEHSPPDRRGFWTSWIQTSAAVGLCAALLVTLATRSVVGEPAFVAWGWRIPFLTSSGLLAISLWIRLKLTESPTFKTMVKEGGASKAPFREAFGTWSNLKMVLIALFSLMLAQGAVWYCAFFYSQVFLERVIKVYAGTVNLIMVAVVVVSAPLYVLFGWLSDVVGRKWVMTLGVVLATAALFPGFHLMTRLANPELDAASARTPVTVTADPKQCSLQFDPIGRAQFNTSCDIAKAVLTGAGVTYRNVPGPAGSLARVDVGGASVGSADGRGLDAPHLARVKTRTTAAVKALLKHAGYPARAERDRTDVVGVFLTLMLFAVGATALYGPQAACLVELFPTRIRYTALSLPYHVGTGWVGGFLPATAYAMVVSSGDIYFGLWYPVIGGVVAVLVAVLLLPETRGRDLTA